MAARISWTRVTLLVAVPLGGCTPGTADRVAQTPVLTIEAARPTDPADEAPPASPRPKPAPPVLRTTCEEARSRYTRSFGERVPPTLSAGANRAALKKRRYLNGCGVPPSMAVHICAAVQNGRAIGVTVTTTPSDETKEACIAGAVSALAFPSRPRFDTTTITLEAAE